MGQENTEPHKHCPPATWGKSKLYREEASCQWHDWLRGEDFLIRPQSYFLEENKPAKAELENCDWGSISMIGVFVL